MKPKLTPAAIEATLQAQFERVSDFVSIGEGEESQAFAFTGDREALIVRVNRSKGGFEKDAYAHDAFSNAALPIPKVHLIAALEENWICVSARAAGETLQALGDGAAVYAGPLAATLDAMAVSDVSTLTGFGPFQTSGAAPFAHWRDHIAAITDAARFDWSDLGLPPTVHDLIEAVVEYAPDLPDIRALVHGDFGSNNILAAKGRITGVIDWSEAMLGDPLYDVANILFWRPWLACMEQQCRFFEREQPHRLQETGRLRCYQLRIGLQSLHEAATGGDIGFAKWALDRCLEIASR